jgi:DNA-binding CsgD family transcriptional regulator
MTVAYSAAIASLRQLAVLGLPGSMMRETLSQVMRRLVPGDLFCIIQHDNRFNPHEGWLNFPELLRDFGVYMTEFHNSREAEAHLTYREFCQRGMLIERMHSSIEGDWLHSGVYDAIYRPSDFRYAVRFALREAGLTRCSVTVTRGHKTRDYSAKDLRRLLAAAPYLTHILDTAVGSWTDRRTVETAEGQLICDAVGHVEYFSPQGRGLLHDIAEVPMTGATLSDPCIDWAKPHLKRLIGETEKLALGRSGEVPVLTRDTARGRYVIRVWRLGASVNTAGLPQLYSVSIRRYIPLALRLLESEVVIGLPAREKSICLMLAEGLESKEIAARLGLSPNTVISYIRSLYSRLGIAGRQELLAKLLPPEA